MNNPVETALIIAGLHEAGIRIQIDGVGAGASAVHALRQLPIQALKIDRMIIRDLEADQRTTRLVQTMFEMGRALGFDVVAKGVETDGQLDLLREMGCRSAQGFLFTEAIDADAAARLLGRSLVARL